MKFDARAARIAQRVARLPRSSAPVLLVVFALLAVHCGKGAAPVGHESSGTPEAAAAGSLVDDDGGSPMDSLEAAAWDRARDGGDDDDTLRLADLVGCTGLRERASSASLRPTAIRAMAYCRDFSELPWLADVGTRSDDGDALSALEAIVEQAARTRRATDPEDAAELHAGCGTLLSLARASDRPAPRRVRAIRALRMLADRGCVKRTEIPTDMDAK